MARSPRVLLVNPWIHDFSAYDFWMRPLGLLYLAAVVRDAGCEVDFIDCVDRSHPGLKDIRTPDFPKSRMDGRGKLLCTEIPSPPVIEDVPKRFKRYGITPEMFHADLESIERPEAVIVTSHMTYWYTGVRETIREIRKALSGVPVLLGGTYASLLPEHARENSGADRIITGESENKIVAAVENAAGRPARKDAAYRTIDDYPLPAFDLLHERRSLPVLTSRGCPFRCGYCASYRIMPGFRRRDPKKVADEIELHHEKFGTQHFAFYDDALLIDKVEHFHVILREIIRRGKPVSFHMPNAIHGREVDSITAELMFNAGCKTVRIGFETSNKERQESSGGKITSKDLLDAAENLERAGYKRKDIDVYVMMGLPGQKASEVEESMRFVHDAGCTVRPVSYTPIPGTPCWEKAVDAKPSLAGEPLLHNNSIFPLQGADMNAEEFAALKDMARDLNLAL